MKLVVCGLGYVGLSNALLLSQKEEVKAYDIDQEKVKLLQQGISPILDHEIEAFLAKDSLNIQFVTEFEATITEADCVIISTPTDYDEQKNYFNTSTVESVIEQTLAIKKDLTIIIKSTVPVGFTERMKQQFQTENIIFSPEFLCEGKALLDNLYPSRIIIGENSQRGKELSEIFQRNALKEDVPCLLTDATEAEAIKLFSNTYLAMRVAYFNELDTYAAINELNTKQIIEGVGLDPRVGDHYNNPSFGYGGYCLPKDTKQLCSDYHQVPNDIIQAIVDANETRKDFITEHILSNKPKTIGIHRLAMKFNSDNFRYSSIQGIIERLSQKVDKIIIYEPTIKEATFQGVEIVNDLEHFKEVSDTIVVNRFEETLADVKEKFIHVIFLVGIREKVGTN